MFGIDDIISVGMKVLDKVIPDPTAKAEAQAIVDGEVAKAQAEYDALPEDQKTNLNRQRPTAINLP